MPRIIPVTSKKLIKKLKIIGYVKDWQKGSHLFLVNRQNRKRVVVPMHSRKNLPVGTLHEIVIHQAGINVDYFNSL